MPILEIGLIYSVFDYVCTMERRELFRGCCHSIGCDILRIGLGSNLLDLLLLLFIRLASCGRSDGIR